MSVVKNEDLLKYKVPDNLADRFQNIMVFAKNMIVKDSEYIERYEDEVSKKFGNLLVKYFEYGLREDEAIELISLTHNYNTSVDEYLDSIINDRDFWIKSVYGLTDITESLMQYSEINDEYRFSENNTVAKLYSLESYDSSLLKKIVIVIRDMIYNNDMYFDMMYQGRDKKDINLETFEKIILSNVFMILVLCNGRLSNLSSMHNDPKLKNTIKYPIFNYILDMKDTFLELENIFKNRLYIQTFNINPGISDVNKLEPSTVERSMVNSGNILVFIDLKFRVSNIIYNNNASVLSDYVISSAEKTSSRITDTDSKLISFQMLFKELNIAYRDILGHDIIDIAMAKNAGFTEDYSISIDTPSKPSISKLKDKFKTDRESITRSLVSIIEDTDEDIFINDFYNIPYDFEISGCKIGSESDSDKGKNIISVLENISIMKYGTFSGGSTDLILNNCYIIGCDPSNANKVTMRCMIDNIDFLPDNKSLKRYHDITMIFNDRELDDILEINKPIWLEKDTNWVEFKDTKWSYSYDEYEKRYYFCKEITENDALSNANTYETIYSEGDILISKIPLDSLSPILKDNKWYIGIKSSIAVIKDDSNTIIVDTPFSALFGNAIEHDNFFWFVKETSSTEKPMLVFHKTASPITVEGSYINKYNDGNIIKTNNIFKYQYGNSFGARTASENDIILYYMKDNYISNGYGVYQYQRSEINQFLDIYKETREYFYQVLSNEAFTNEEYFGLYCKLYIVYLSVMRFITAKLDTTRDINTFSKDDIENFLKSFGLGSIIDVLDLGNFSNSESYAKSLIKYYIKLMQNKGSRAVIDVIREVFSIRSTELEMYRKVLVRTQEKPDSTATYKMLRAPQESIENVKYRMLTVKYDTDDILTKALDEISSSDELTTIIAEDKYWDPENTKEDLLDKKLHVNFANTKYLIPEVTNNLSEGYFTTRLVFEILDFICRKEDRNEKKSRLVISEEGVTNGEISISEYINSIRYLWYKYMYISAPNEMAIGNLLHHDSNTYLRSFRIRDDVHKLYIDEKYLVDNTLKDLSETDKFNCSNSQIYRRLQNLEYIKKDGNDKEYVDLSSYYTVDENGGYTLNEDFLSKMFSGFHLEAKVKNVIETYLKCLAPIYEISKENSSVDTLTTMLNITDADVLPSIFTMLYGIIGGSSSGLIIDIHDGDINNMNIPAPLMDFLLRLYEHTFFECGKHVFDPLLVDINSPLIGSVVDHTNNLSSVHTYNTSVLESGIYKFSEELCNIETLNEDSLSEIKNAIATACNSLITLTKELLISLVLEDSDKNMINFIKTTIEFFISYTSEIYNFSYRNAFNSYSEGIYASDSWELKCTYTDVDSFYYDERLDISIEEK